MSEEEVKDNRGYTIDDALDCIGFGRFQWTLLLMSGIGFFASTSELILMALLQQPLMAQWPDSHTNFSLLQTCIFTGELLGGLVWGSISDKLGRRFTFIGTALLATVFGLLSAASPNMAFFLFTRFGLGLAIGGSHSIDFVYFVEFVPASSRGFRTTFIILLGICSFFYMAGLGYFVLPWSWRAFVLGTGAPSAVLFLIRLFWKWESPRFLLGQGRLDEATKVLRVMAKANGRPLPPGQLISLEPVGKDSKKAPWYSSYKSILDAGLTRKVATMSILFFGQTFGYYGLTNWLRKLMVAKGVTNLSTCSMFMIIGVAEIPGLLLSTLLIESKGRRLVFLVNFFGSAISSLLLVFVSGYYSFLAVYALLYFFIVGSWTALYVTTPELFPTTVRASAFTVSHCCGKVAGALSPIFFGSLWDLKVNPMVILLIISGSFGVAALTAAALLMETAGQRLQDAVSPTIKS